MSEPSNRPWAVQYLDLSSGASITCGDPTNPDDDVVRNIRTADAEHIVHCVNIYPGTIEALNAAKAKVDSLTAALKTAESVLSDLPSTSKQGTRTRSAWQEIRAALKEVAA